MRYRFSWFHFKQNSQVRPGQGGSYFSRDLEKGTAMHLSREVPSGRGNEKVKKTRGRNCLVCASPEEKGGMSQS